jgi:hypothetical protein
VRGAAENAIQLVKVSRVKPTKTSAIVGDYVRLSSFTQWLGAAPHASRLLAKWPRNPGYTVGVKGGMSALDAAWRFARSIRSGALIGGHIGTGLFESDPRVQRAIASAPERLIVRWAEGVVRELVEHTLPPEVVWPNVGSIVRDCAGLFFVLRDEYEQATSSGRKKRSPEPVPPDSVADGELREQIRPLNGMERACILALFEKEVFHDTAAQRPGQKDLSLWAAYDWDTTFKNALSAVVKARFLDNEHHHGKRGGYFLTELGKRAGKLLKFDLS